MDKEYFGGYPVFNSMSRKDVYKLIDGEREYQEDMPEHSDKVAQNNTSIAAWLIYIERLLTNAKDRIYYLDEKGALECIRKLTAVGVACMEHNDTPVRVNPYIKGKQYD